MSALERLRALGTRSAAQIAEAKAAEYATRGQEAAKDFARRVEAADRLARAIMGDEAPPPTAWQEWGAGMLLAPLGGPIMFGDEPSTSHRPEYDGEDGELIFYDHNPPEIWYRPRLHNDSARITDAAHLGRMIVAGSIYA